MVLTSSGEKKSDLHFNIQQGWGRKREKERTISHGESRLAGYIKFPREIGPIEYMYMHKGEFIMGIDLHDYRG